jgi:FecR protein
MSKEHYKKMMSAFVNRELDADALSEIAEHILVCTDCRAEHDRVRLGSMLAATMTQHEAPQRVWNNIDGALDEGTGPQMTLIPDARFFRVRSLVGYAAGLIVVAGLMTFAYFRLFGPGAYEARHTFPPDQVQSEESTGIPIDPNIILPGNSDVTASNADTQTPEQAGVASWQFETLAGAPSVGGASGNGRLAVGDYLETDAASRARIKVADIGNVEIQPNSRVKFVGTTEKEHRLSLERGVLQAKIAAPPRLFIVDTPSAVAVDLGCEYKLEVDKAGNSRLHVTTGFVALERDGRESIVPAGAVCVTMRGRGLGTPYSADTSEVFRKALEKFDFLNGGSRSVDAMLANRGFYDMITLWHLLFRVKKSDREKVYNALAAYVAPPNNVTLDGIMRLDKKMLADWRVEVERVWFE